MPDELHLLRAAIDRMSACVSLMSPTGEIVLSNPAAARLIGRTVDEIVGRSAWDLFPEPSGGPFRAAFQRVVDGEPEATVENYYSPLDRWFASRFERVGDLVHVVSRDVTEEIRRRRRLEALARVSAVLTTEDPSDVTRTLAEAMVEVLDADCSIALLSPDRAWLELAATAFRDASSLQAGSGITRFPSDRGHPGEALRTRAAVLAQTESVQAAMASDVDDPKLRAVAERYRTSSLLVVPLVAERDVIGVLMAMPPAGSPPLTEDDRALATEIAPAIGLYLAYARRRGEANSLRNRLAAITDSNPALVAFVGPDLRYQYVNATYEQWFGRPREYILGRRVSDVLGPLAWAAVEPYVQVAVAGEPAHFRIPIPYPTGLRQVHGSYLPIAGPAGLEGFVSVVLDVTAEARFAAAEERRREDERRATRRLESLLAVTGRLAGANTADEIARVVVDEGVEALEAELAGMWLVEGDDAVLVRQRGYRSSDIEAFGRIPLAASGPLAECLRTGKPLWMESRAAYAAAFPELERVHRPDPPPPLAFATVPILVEGRAVGCFNYTFHDEQRLTTDERTYLEVLASSVSEAVRRSRLYTQLRDLGEVREAMIQSSPAAIVLLDREGAVHAWNPAAERIFGWSADEVLGRPIPTAGSERRDELFVNVEQVLGGGVIAGLEVLRLRKSGEWFDLELYAAPVRLSDGRALALAIMADISERKRVERGRQLVAEASAIFARSLDAQQTLQELVRLAVRDFAEVCFVDLLGEHGSLDRVAASREEADPGAPMPRRLSHAPERDGSSWVIHHRRPRVLRDVDPHELERWAHDPFHLAAMRAVRPRSFLSVPLTAGDRVFGALSFVSRTRNFDDVDLEIARELASHAASALENARLYQVARAARSEAEAANRAKDQFLAMLGHELRNPLAPIFTALDLMALRAPEQLTREREVIERQMGHLMRLVDDLLDVSRITRGLIDLQRERIAIATVVARAVELASPLVVNRRHHLAIDVDPTLVVHGDPTRLSQVLANLIGNAAKYTRPGGNIVVTGSARGEAVAVTVRDDGMGIEPELLPTLFEVFVQGPQEMARTEGGLGLGLAIVRSLVEQHGGTVSIRSEGAGRGTEVLVTLPLASAQDVEPAPAPVEAPEPRCRRVLVVDDNVDAAALLGEALDARGHVTRTAFDGPSALRIAEEFRPEVAVLDIGLPVMDGYELATLLRASLPVRLIAVTGYGQQADHDRSRAAGFHAHLTKPVPVDKLVRLLSDPS